MPNPFNELLAGLAGGFTGYGQQQQQNLANTRQATLDKSLAEDRASQVALRTAQAAQEKAKADQDAYLRTPEFKTAFQAARGGDEGAIAHVASAVAGHPDAASYMNALVRPPKTQYDSTRGVMVDTEHGTAKPIEGLPPAPTDKGKSDAEIPGTQAWKDRIDYEEKTRAKYRPDNSYDWAVDPTTPGAKAVLLPKEEIARRGWTKAPSAASGSSQGALASVEDMNTRIGQLQEGFNYFGSGAAKGKINPSWQTRDALEEKIAHAQATNQTAVVDQLKSGLANAVGYGPNQNDPDYQKYRQVMQAARFIGEETAKAQKGRQNEAAVQRDIQYAMPIPSDFQNPAKLADKLERLRNLAKLATATQPNTTTTPAPTGGRGGGQSTAQTPDDPKARAAAWKTANPQQPNETPEAYYARFLAAHP